MTIIIQDTTGHASLIMWVGTGFMTTKHTLDIICWPWKIEVQYLDKLLEYLKFLQFYLLLVMILRITSRYLLNVYTPGNVILFSIQHYLVIPIMSIIRKKSTLLENWNKYHTYLNFIAFWQKSAIRYV